MSGERLNSQAQELVLHVLDYFERETKTKRRTYITCKYLRVCNALLILRQTVYAIKLRNPVLYFSTKKRPPTKPITKVLRKSCKLEMRNIVYNMYKEGKHVTLQILKDELKTKEIVTLYRQSLATLFMDIGLKFHREDNRRALDEIHSVALMQSVFLNKYIYDIFIEKERRTLPH